LYFTRLPGAGRKTAENLDSEVVNELNLKSSAGTQSKRIFIELDDMCSKKFNDFADFIQDLVNRLTKQLKANENDVKFLWKRGNDLLFSRNLADQRVQRCWEILRTHSTATSRTEALSSSLSTDGNHSDVLYSDIWLAETKYSIASARLLQVNEECNKQLKKIFSLGKDLESKRLGIVTRASGEHTDIKY